jgi:hypothetical protein
LQRLEVALAALALTPSAMTRVAISNLTPDQLNNMKKKVKNELKNYDEIFKKIFGHTPERTQKEPMRKLYVYYKAIKQHMSKGGV